MRNLKQQICLEGDRECKEKTTNLVRDILISIRNLRPVEIVVASIHTKIVVLHKTRTVGFVPLKDILRRSAGRNFKIRKEGQ